VRRDKRDGGLFVSDPIRDEESLSAELSALRSALRDVRAPDDEPALRQAARVLAAARAAADVGNETKTRPSVLTAARARFAKSDRRLPLAAAAAAALVAIAVLVALRAERAGGPGRPEQARVPERPAASARASGTATPVPAAARTAEPRPAFRPISFSRGFSPAESYSVVRVRIELASTVTSAGSSNPAIEADLLVGEDGLARAIRFDTADTLPVYAASNPVSGERR
jgi:hypothetical protein